jgi:hypothetical protein
LLSPLVAQVFNLTGQIENLSYQAAQAHRVLLAGWAAPPYVTPHPDVGTPCLSWHSL